MIGETWAYCLLDLVIPTKSISQFKSHFQLYRPFSWVLRQETIYHAVWRGLLVDAKDHLFSIA